MVTDIKGRREYLECVGAPAASQQLLWPGGRDVVAASVATFDRSQMHVSWVV
jgi:hypothetical protein